VALVEQALTELHNLVNDSDEYDADVADRLQFLSEQISLLFMKQKRYSYVFICRHGWRCAARYGLQRIKLTPVHGFGMMR
jgi:hypothetical protein